MGRSQVERNKTHGRPGQGGRCRHDGAGRGRVRRGVDTKKLGDNSFRFVGNRNHAVDDEVEDGNDDFLDGQFISQGEYVGASQHHHGVDEDHGLFSYGGSASKRNVFDTDLNGGDQDYLFIDIAGMAKCLELIPIHDRLNFPRHIGTHLEDTYGCHRGSTRKKTLAELREDAKITERLNSNNAQATADEMVLSRKNTEQTSEIDHSKDVSTQPNLAASDEDDLEAWLDDMIS